MPINQASASATLFLGCAAYAHTKHAHSFQQNSILCDSLCTIDRMRAKTHSSYLILFISFCFAFEIRPTEPANKTKQTNKISYGSNRIAEKSRKKIFGRFHWNFSSGSISKVWNACAHNHRHINKLIVKQTPAAIDGLVYWLVKPKLSCIEWLHFDWTETNRIKINSSVLNENDQINNWLCRSYARPLLNFNA